MTAVDPSFIRYLAAKRSIDDQALNRQVWDVVWSHLGSGDPARPLRVLEVGAGIGTMIERILEWTRVQVASYTALDSQPGLLAEAEVRLRAWAAHRGWGAEAERAGRLAVQGDRRSIAVEFLAMEVFDALEGGAVEGPWDLVLAHAVLDLLDLERTLAPLVARAAPGGILHFTLNFDGATIFAPPAAAQLEARLEHAYHATMDERRVSGQPTGGSRTGRLLFGALTAAGAEILASGASDWVVFPRQGAYTEDEATFLGAILDTVEEALRGRSEISSGELNSWLAARRGHLARGQLSYIAHQLDFAARRPG
ncbi:MAG TPA: class I SAM-dependent methyltransferase [Anaerolineales bacterium]